MNDKQLDALVRHAEYGHLEGQDYDTITAVVAEVRRLQDERDDLDRMLTRCVAARKRVISQRDALQDGIRNIERVVGRWEPMRSHDAGEVFASSSVYDEIEELVALLDDATGQEGQ